MGIKPRRKRVPITLPEIDGANCAQCSYAEAADKSWKEFRPCALHKEPAPPEPVKKFYRVTWIEKYEKVFEAETEDAAIENRDDVDAFQGCEEVTAQEVEKCRRAAPAGARDCFGCDECESGWTTVVAQEVV